MTAQRGTGIPAIGWVVGILVVAVVVAGAVFAFYQFRGEAEPELTIEELLAEVEGRPLTAAEVSELLDVGQAVCELDEVILDELWRRLDDDQLDFQDFVFAHLCPERSILYAAHTGRYVTEEAEDSGVVPSTTRPTTTTARTTTSTAATSSTGDPATTSLATTTPTTSTTATSGLTTTAGPGESTVTLDPGR